MQISRRTVHCSWPILAFPSCSFFFGVLIAQPPLPPPPSPLAVRSEPGTSHGAAGQSDGELPRLRGERSLQPAGAGREGGTGALRVR